MTAWADAARSPRSHRFLLAVLLAGLAARAVLAPLTHGADFTVWDLASQATLRGVNVYAHHPAYSGGPYTYLPLFLYMEVPMQWLAQHTGAPFTVLGKLPILAADVAVAILIARLMRRRGADDRHQAIAAALFFLNPLVLYNGAFYGRFDSVCLAFLMLAAALHRPGRTASWLFAVSYALAIAAKTFPVFLLPWLLRRGRGTAIRVLAVCAVVLLAIAAPYVIGSPGALATDLTYSASKLPGGLSWQVVLHGLPAAVQVGAGDILLAGFVAAAIVVAVTVDDLTLGAAATMVLFLLLSKQVIEQYLLWPLPFLVLLAVGRRSPAAWSLVAELTAAGMLVNASFHPFGVQPVVVNVIFAAALAATLLRLLSAQTRRGARTRSARIQGVRGGLAAGPAE